MPFFMYYLFFCLIILIIFYPITSMNAEKDTIDDYFSEYALFFACLLISLIPLINVLSIVVSIYEYNVEKNKKIANTKIYPGENSLKSLKEIYFHYQNWNKISEYKVFIEKLDVIFNTLETKCTEPEYRDLLSHYEFTFARINSIIKESSFLNINAYNQVLENSKELIEEFLKDCHLILINEEEIAIKTEEAILNRFLKEINEEKDFLVNRKS